MQLCVLNHIFGEKLHLLYDLQKKTFRWIKDIPHEAWILGNSDADLSVDRLAELTGNSICCDPPKPWAIVASQLRKEDPTAILKWRYMLPPDVFELFVKNIIRMCEETLSAGDNEYYLNVYLRTTRFLKSLERACVDENRLYEYYAENLNPTIRSILKSCFPENDGKTKAITYNQTATITGRLTIKSGPQILTLKKNMRNIFRSRYENGHIIMIDFISIEPIITLSEFGKDVPDDVYKHINNTLFNGKMERKQIKLMVIALLYGAGEQTLEKISGLSGGELFSITESLTEFLGIRMLQARLFKEFNEKKKIRNKFGRIIAPKKDNPSILLNYFVQSSAVDAALLGFSNGMDLAKIRGWKIHPLFVIHDALIIDVHPDYVQYIKLVIDACSSVDNINSRLPVKYEEM